MTAAESEPAAKPPSSGGFGTTFRYLVSLVAAGLVLGAVLTTQLDAILAGLGLPIGILASVVVGLPVAALMRRLGWRRWYQVMGVGALLGLVPWGLMSLATPVQTLWTLAVGAGVALVAWLALKFQTLPLRFVATGLRAPAMAGLALVVLVLSAGAALGSLRVIYGAPPSPESIKTVAAFEVPLPTEFARRQLLAVLRREADAEGVHVDAAEKAQMESMAVPEMSDTVATIDATAWRGSKDNRLELSATDRSHPGLVWITFFRGEDLALAERFRDRVMHEVRALWPETLSLPVLPNGGLPYQTDLVATPGGYRVKRSAASRYELPLSSPLLEREGAAGS